MNILIADNLFIIQLLKINSYEKLDLVVYVFQGSRQIQVEILTGLINDHNINFLIIQTLNYSQLITKIYQLEHMQQKRTRTSTKNIDNNFLKFSSFNDGMQSTNNPLMLPPHLSRYQNSILFSIQGSTQQLIKLKNKVKHDSYESSYLINNTQIDENLHEENNKLKQQIQVLKQQLNQFKEILKTSQKKIQQQQYNMQKLQKQYELLKLQTQQQKHQMLNSVLGKFKLIMCKQCANNFKLHWLNDKHSSYKKTNIENLNKNLDINKLGILEDNFDSLEIWNQNIEDQNKICQLSKKMEKLLVNYNKIKDSVKFYVNTQPNKKTDYKSKLFSTLQEELFYLRQYYRMNQQKNISNPLDYFLQKQM